MPVRLFAVLACLAAGACVAASPNQRAAEEFDLVVYGGTSAGVIAAVQARTMGHSVVLVCPERHVGGMSASGLGWTDSGDKDAIGGLAREFYRRVKAHYDEPEAWRFQEPEEYSRYRADADAMWVFEPHVAEAVFEALLDEYEIPVHRDAWLDRERGVEMDGTRIVSITTLDGAAYRGSVFLDTTYEGDLMAAAGVSYTVGRESNATYGEALNGVQTKNARYHQFKNRVSPYVVADDPASGLLPRVHAGGPGEEGAGDHRIQAYNYRLCLTNEPANRLPFPKPEGYEALQYELLLRDLLAGSRHVFGKFDPAPNKKTDTNNSGSFSTDNIGRNYDYPEASYARRAEILEEHERYQKGYYWFLCNDPRVPEDVRERMNQWGLAADEFTESGGWPHQIYVREARRMLGEFVKTERSLRGLDPTPDSVGMGSYNMDSHHVQRYVAFDEPSEGGGERRAYVLNEGDVQVSPGRSYEIALGALLPRRDECSNLLVPVAVSASHIAYGSIRMEPVFMILAQSAATLACLAIERGEGVHEVSYAELRSRLLADGQVLE